MRIVLDAGALLAWERADRSVAAQLEAARRHGADLVTTGIVVAQVWRDPGGRQARLARLLRAVDVLPVDDRLGRRAGALLAAAGSGDAADATVACSAVAGDRVLTSDPEDIARLLTAAGVPARVVQC